MRISTHRLESMEQVLQNSLLYWYYKFAHIYTQAKVCGAGAPELLTMQATLICACLHTGWCLWHRCCRTPYYTDINLHIPRKTTCLHTCWSLWRRCCRTARYAGNTNLRMSTHMLESVAQVLHNSLLYWYYKFAHIYTQAEVCGAGAA